jgi:DNA primase
MAGISPATLERIRAASDIVDVIGASVPLKKAGANFTALCPFHKEKSPSFNVNPHKQIFHCFGCHKGGDVFTFVKEYENIGFVDAVRRLAERAKIPLEFDNNPAEQQSRHIKDELLQIHEQITQRWQNCLANEAAGQLARDYLAKRGVSADAIKLFRLGAAPELWDDTVNWAKSKNYEQPLVEKAGLIIRKEEIGNYYDRFRGRLIFPICDEQGRVIGFSGRILSGDEKTAKYVNSPETPIFTKSKVFFGLDKSKRALLDAQSAIVCEGQLDLIACFMAGVQNVVAPQGTAFTDQHARILTRYVGEVVICFDSDLAGQKASIRGLEGLLASGFSQRMNVASLAFAPGVAPQDALLSSGLAIRVVVLPSPHDPDSFIKEFGTDAFRALVKKAESFFDFYLGYLCATNDATTDLGKTVIVKEMAERLLKTGNHVLVDNYAQKTAMRLGVSHRAVLAEFNKFIRAAKPTFVSAEQSEENFTEEESEKQIPPPNTYEFHLLKLLLLHDDLVAWTALHLDVNWILHPLARQIVSQRLDAQTKETWKSLGAFLDECESAETKSLITEAVAEERKIPNPETQLADVVKNLRNQFFDRQIAALMQKSSQPEISDTEKIKFLCEQQKLREQKRAPLSQLEN